MIDEHAQREHENAVRRCILTATRDGASELNEILKYCEGADPALVSRLLSIEPRASANTNNSPHRPEYESSSTLSRRLPAADPSRSQWWFSTGGLIYLSKAVEARAATFQSPRILSLGTPTLGWHLAQMHHSLEILDVDEHVLRALPLSGTNGQTREYDAADPFPSELKSRFQIAVLDPPWYTECVYKFVQRALTGLVIDGEAFCTLPGRLTRPGAEALCTDLVSELVNAGHSVLSVEHGSVQYQVPRFELAALDHLDGFRGMPWRSGDLLHFRKRTEQTLRDLALTKLTTHTFVRNPVEFRIFMRGTARAVNVIAKTLPLYSKNISTRVHREEDADVWSTEKAGIQVGEAGPIREALASWSERKNDKVATVLELVARGHATDYATEVVNKLDEVFSLWSKFAAEPPLRTDIDIQNARATSLTDWATYPSKREHDDPSDTFRAPYQRDRDRVLWSSGLRRLSSKTQLFPVQHDDDLRQRLTHSIEVFQLAATIGASFGLDGDLIEAGALAHDVGHTPFGHAGEHALNKLLIAIDPDLGGFNHYEHGVDVIRYLEGPYYVSPATSLFGLNLTPEVLECVFKHTYCHRGDSFSSELLLAQSKHGDLIAPGYCHLEGQAVRVADKLSYLVSDLEDGIRLGILSNTDMLSCRFFHRLPLDFTLSPNRTFYQKFLEQRRWILKILMEDVLRASSTRLARLPLRSSAAVRQANDYLIQHSPEMLVDVEEIWIKLQAGRLHKDRRVVTANLQAARIVAELTIAYSILPDLVDERFRKEHLRLMGSKYMDYYRKRVGSKVRLRRDLVAFLPMHVMIGTAHPLGSDISVPIEQLILAKDYVAALSDSRARLFHRQAIDTQSGDK